MDPRYNSNFEAAVAFTQGQINSLRLKNGSSNRTVSAIESMDVTYEEEGGEDIADYFTTNLAESAIQRLKSELRQLKSKLKMTDSKRGPAKKNQAYKFDKKNPGAYIPSKEWKLLNQEQMDAAREARKEAGIPTRQVHLLSTQGSNSKGTDVEDSDEGVKMELDSHCDTTTLRSIHTSLQQVPPGLLVAPKVRFVDTTKRNLHYANTNRARQLAKEAAKDTTEGITRKIGALSTST
jgi:hypothetical protein